MKTKPYTIIYQNTRLKPLWFSAVLGVLCAAIVWYLVCIELDEFLNDFNNHYYGGMAIAIILLLGNAILLGTCWLSGRYVLSIKKNYKNQLVVTTWSITGKYKQRIYPDTILQNNEKLNNLVQTQGLAMINEPWVKLNTHTGKTLVVDVIGDFNLNVA
jgi:hypothetical protein